MNNAKEVRDAILTSFKEKGNDKIYVTEINDCSFPALDLTVPDSIGDWQVYRIVVIRHTVK